MTETPDTALAALAVQLAALKGNLGQAREDLETAKRDLAARIDQIAADLAAQAERLDKNPLSKGNLPEDWTPPQTPDDTVDPRAVGSPALVATMLTSCSQVGRRQGSRFVAFYACMFYALMRPSEVAALTRNACHLPDSRMGPPDLRRRQPRPGEGLHRRRPGP